MLDPEPADARVAMGQSEAVRRLGMGKESGVEVQADAQFGRPVHPALEMRGADLVPLHRPAAVLQVDGVQVEAVPAGNEAKGLLRIGPQLVGIACPAGIIAGGQDAAAAQAGRVLEPAHVVSLPAIQGEWDAIQLLQGGLCIDAEIGVVLLGHYIGFFHCRRCHEQAPEKVTVHGAEEGTGPCFRPEPIRFPTIIGRKMDQSPPVAVKA